MCSPTSWLPVKVTLRTAGLDTSASPIALPEPVTHWMASAGRPASSSISVSLSADSGVSLAGFMTTALPPAIAGPTLCATRLSGKLKGEMATTMPTGTRTVKPNFISLPGAASSGIVSPKSRFASSADQVMVWTHRSTSSRPSLMTLPSSLVIVSPRSCLRSFNRTTARIRISYRSNALSARMAFAPRSALLIAISTSSTVAAGTVSIGLPE